MSSEEHPETSLMCGSAAALPHIRRVTALLRRGHSLRLTGAAFPNKQRNSAESELLHARSARVGFGLIDDDAVIEIADAQRDVVH